MSLILALGFLACILLKDIQSILYFFIVYSIYLYFRYRKMTIPFLFAVLSVLAVFLSVKSYTPAVKGEYEIVEIKKQYYIATNHKTKVLVMTDLDLSYSDVIYIEEFETIHTDDNFTLFSFTDYNKQNDIYEKAKTFHVISYSNYLKSNLYRYISKHNNASVYKSIYYGIHDDQIEDIYTMLGCTFISAYYFLYHLLRKYFDEKKGKYVLLFLGILYGYFFTFADALVRFLVYQLATLYFLKKEDQIAMTIFVFCILLPNKASSFGFILPLFLQLVSYFCTNQKWILQKMVLISFMFMYFKKIDLVSLCLFNFLRKIYGILFFIPFLPLYSLPKIEIHYAPQILFVFSFFVVFISGLKKFKWSYLLLFLIPFAEIYCNPFFQVYMLNIGQGDCSVIVEPFQQSVVMIDCGQSRYRDNVEKIVYPFLQNRNIHKIDYLILSHDDYDHDGGYASLSKKIQIRHVIRNRDEKVDVKYPFYSLLKQRNSKESNDQSIINYFVYDNVRYLFMADASIEVEKDLIQTYNLQCDILKVGHHGSNTSSGAAFLEKTKPKLALISVGYKNRYNHPSTEVVSSLHNLGIDTLMTKDCGSIGIFTFHKFAFFITKDGLFGIIQI